MMKRLFWLAFALTIAAAPASAQTYPAHMIRATIPFGAGSATDVVPRLVFERLAADLGQTIVVENRVGAGGTVGTMAVAKAEPDGYTLLAHSSALTVAPSIFPNLGYDASRDLAAVLMIGYSANVMIIPAARPWQNLQEFLTAAKAKGSTINFASVGIGTAVHVSAEKFRVAAGFDATHVPYRGGSEALADILGGRVDFYFCPLATALPLIREGQVRALVVSTAKRVGELPEVPGMAETGLQNADSAIWFGVFAPAKTPRDIVTKLHQAGNKVLETPQMQARLKQLGVEAWPMTPEAMDELVKRETAANADLVKLAGIKP
jgi:tripartite-type tricarboxylate transporter receptor subunit TctC